MAEDGLPEVQAGEYVLGVLTADERAAFELRMVREPELARLVAAQCGMPEPDDRHRSAVRAYREKLRAELERLPFRGLAGFRHPEQARSPRLSALYVAPNLRLLRPSATIAEQWQEIERQLLLPGLSPDERWHLGRRQYALVERLRQAAAAGGVDPKVAEAIAALSREVIEAIAWEVVPELAESIIRRRA